MRIRSLGARFTIPCVVLGLIVTGCGSGDEPQTSSSSVGMVNDINPKDPSELREGGNLRFALTNFPATFNTNHVDADADAQELVAWAMPGTVISNAAGEVSVDHNYFTDVQLTGTNPQQVTYTINPKAVWSDGTPITWEDLRTQAEAMSGRNTEFQVAATQGYSRVDKVERGVDDRQAILTFGKHYAEWQGLFNPLYPKATNETPQAFNDVDRNGLPVSSGPFMITSIDKAQQRIVLSRNPKWWGDKPKLDTVTFSVLDYSARINALQNNELDYATVFGIDEVKTATNSAGIKVRRAPRPTFSHFTFNGAPGAILADPKLRVAISKAIDRQGIATASLNGVVEDPKPLNNHIFMAGQKGYQDNAAAIAYDPDAAARMLDELGWKLNGDVREKDGKKLEVRDVMYQQEAWVQSAQIAQQNLAKIGVKLIIQTVPGNRLNDIIENGEFDIVQFTWSGSIFPLGALPQIYAYDPALPQGNKGKIGTPELNALIEDVISELDQQKAIELANKADKMIFEEGFSVPMTQSPGAVAVRDNVANFGAFGLASIDYTKIGFVK